MENLVIGAAGSLFRILLRYWAKDNTVLSQNIIDAEQFAQQCGLSIWEAKRFNRSIDEFIDKIAEDFIKEFGNQIENKERKKIIFKQIQDDIEKVSISETKLISAISNPEDLRNIIMNQSKKERETWSNAEIGVYTNCVRYISKAGIEFVTRLPSFTPTALSIIIERQNEYYKSLQNILIDIHSMTSLIKSVDATYREYESIYREKLIEKYSKVELIGSGLNNARNITRYDISSAYVELSCIDEAEYGDEIELSEVFANNNIVWIKGEAGSGKTTFLQWVAICAAKNEYNKIDNIRNTIPIVIELRNAKWPIDLQDAVNRITSVYGNNCPDGWIVDLLKKKRAILLFDGLDEINHTKRAETYNFIEDMVENNPQIKILLTARNSVKDSINCSSVDYEILPMNIENIKEFIVYWHRSVLRKDAIIKDKDIDRLQFNLKNKIVESQPLKSLARNPLLCAMICALNYVNNEQLPENKMELYEKCCEMLMDARDNQRNIGANIYDNMPNLDYSKKRKILEEMAYWMMNGNVSSENKSNVLKYLKHLLQDTNILSDKKFEYDTKILLNYLIERSGIIREPEEEVIDFIHKTFMEFLAIKAICRNCNWNVLIREACNPNWKETILMCFQEMGKDSVQYVLKRLVEVGQHRNDDRYVLIASLGASNAVFLADDNIKKQIDYKIKRMIPPKQGDISEIAQAGTYLLPFLKDSDKYSSTEKEKCLILLNRLETEEAIPDILSFVSGNGSNNVIQYALFMLSQYEESILEEYNVKEQLKNIMTNSINGNSLTMHESMLNMLSSEALSDEDTEKIKKIKDLCLICGVSEESLYKGNTDLLWHLKGCTKVHLKGDVQRINFLQQFTHIKDLCVETTSDLSDVINDLADLRNLVSVKRLCIDAQKLNYICEKNLKNMKNLQIFELHCNDITLEIAFDNFDYLTNLHKVVIDVHEYLIDDLIRWRDDLQINNNTLKISIISA